MTQTPEYWNQPQQVAGQAQPAPAVPEYVTPAPPRRSRVWIPILIIVALLAVMVIAISSCTASLAGMSQQTSYGSDTVAVIQIDNTIQYDGSACSPEGLKMLLDEAEDNPNIAAVVLRVNSGGGVATAGEEMSTYVRNFSKPIVVSTASVNASAAYEISSQANYIFTAHTSAVGAIGVDLTVTDYSGLLSMLGISVENITSTESKDSSYGTRPLTDAERAYYQDEVNQINNYFVATVAKGRGMSEDSVRALATGMEFTGDKAVENGLADEIGTLEDACDYAAERAGCGSHYSVSTMDDPAASSMADLLNALSYNNTDALEAARLEQLIAALNEGEGNGVVR